MPPRSTREVGIVNPWIMLISAAIVGYFGWVPTFIYTTNQGQYLPYVAIYEWTLQGASIGFAAGGLLAFATAAPAALLYGITGVLAAAGMIVVAVMQDPMFYVMNTYLLYLFAFVLSIAGIAAIRDGVAILRAPPPLPGEQHPADVPR